MGRGDAVAILTRGFRGDNETLVAIAATIFDPAVVERGPCPAETARRFRESDGDGEVLCLAGIGANRRECRRSVRGSGGNDQ